MARTEIRFILLVIFWIILEPGPTGGNQDDGVHDDHSYMLVHRLMANYESDMLPRCAGHPLPVKASIDLVLRSILTVDEPTQVVTAYLWLRWYWHDCRLKWNATEYGGLDRVVVSSERLWIPDITLYDSTSDEYWLDGLEYYYPAVQSNGDVALLVPVVSSFSCKMDVTYFPFDQQECKIKFASWSYHGYEMDITNHTAAGDTSVFASNGEWNLIGVPVKRNLIVYSCCEEPYPDVTFSLIIQRQHLYYFMNLVLPCLLITVIGMFVFYLPPESGEKIGLGITVLLSLVVFLLMVSENMPATSETIPVIQEYFACTIVLVSLSCIMTVVLLNFHHQGRDGKPRPGWLHALMVGKVAKLLCMDLSDKDKLVNEGDVNMIKRDGKGHCMSSISACDKSSLPNPSGNKQQMLQAEASLLTEQTRMLQELLDRARDVQMEGRKEGEWRKLGLVLDRVFMVLYCISSLIICFFLSSESTVVCLNKYCKVTNSSMVFILADQCEFSNKMPN